MKTPDANEVASALQASAHAYARANQGSDAHPLGHAEVGSFEEIFSKEKFARPPGVLSGFAVRFKDGTTYLVNVHQVPGTVPR
jgi:hypothetical protein